MCGLDKTEIVFTGPLNSSLNQNYVGTRFPCLKYDLQCMYIEYKQCTCHQQRLRSVCAWIHYIKDQSFYVKVYKTLYYEDPFMDFIYIWPDGRYRSKVFIGSDTALGDNLGVKVTEVP